MQKTFFIAIFAALFALSSSPMFAQTEKASEKKTITGEVIDISCYVDHGSHGAKHKKCAEACIESGLPIGILDQSGKVYLAVKGHEPATKILSKYIADDVKVTGAIAERGGIAVIDVEKVEKVK
ncbi:MAG: hypothetical protein ACP5ON_08520 [Bacteroidota bacterium]